jgi:hypothetical protein
MSPSLQIRESVPDTKDPDANVKEDSDTNISLLIVTIVGMVAFAALFSYLIFRENERKNRFPLMEQRRKSSNEAKDRKNRHNS